MSEKTKKRKSDKLPAFQFYPGDWRKDPGVQSLNYHDRGVWFEILCLMHESEERGRLLLNGKAMPEDALARLLGLDKQILFKTLKALREFGVASKDDEGVLFCRRMVRDEDRRAIAIRNGKKGGNPGLARASNDAGSEEGVNPNATPGDNQKSTPSASSSDSTSVEKEKKEKDPAESFSSSSPSLSDVVEEKEIRDVRELHAWYCRVTGLELDFEDYANLWEKLLCGVYNGQVGLLHADARLILRYLPPAIVKGTRNSGSILPKYLLNSRKFKEELARAKLELGRTKPMKSALHAVPGAIMPTLPAVREENRVLNSTGNAAASAVQEPPPMENGEPLVEASEEDRRLFLEQMRQFRIGNKDNVNPKKEDVSGKEGDDGQKKKAGGGNADCVPPENDAGDPLALPDGVAGVPPFERGLRVELAEV